MSKKKDRTTIPWKDTVESRNPCKWKSISLTRSFFLGNSWKSISLNRWKNNSLNIFLNSFLSSSLITFSSIFYYEQQVKRELKRIHKKWVLVLGVPYLKLMDLSSPNTLLFSTFFYSFFLFCFSSKYFKHQNGCEIYIHSFLLEE